MKKEDKKNDHEFQLTATIIVTAAITLEKKRSANQLKDKSWWSIGYKRWNDKEFKRRLRITHDTFTFIHDLLLENIRPYTEKTLANLQPNPITVQT